MSDLLFRPRPSLSAVEATGDCLILTGPNYNVTFRGVPVVRAITALLEVLGPGLTRSEAVRVASIRSEHAEKFVEYAFDLLESHACLFSSAEPATTLSQLDEFIAALGQDPEARRRRLAAGKALLVAPSSGLRELQGCFDRAGVGFDSLGVSSNTDIGPVLDALRGRAAASRLVCAWGLSYRAPFARRLNELAIELETPILFGACEGLMGRIGPHVIPGASACLECYNRRSLSNAGAGELEALLAYRRRWANTVELGRPTHPTFAHAIAEIFALEASQILALSPPQVVNAVLEMPFGTWQSQRHTLHRVPRCDACFVRQPEHLAWDAQMLAPKLKSGVA